MAGMLAQFFILKNFWNAETEEATNPAILTKQAWQKKKQNQKTIYYT